MLIYFRVCNKSIMTSSRDFSFEQYGRYDCPDQGLIKNKCQGASTKMYHSGNLISISTNISNIYKHNVYCFCYWVGPDKKPTNCIFHGTNICKPISIDYNWYFPLNH